MQYGAFGSAYYGLALGSSDIDLLVFVPLGHDWKAIKGEVAEIARDNDEFSRVDKQLRGDTLHFKFRGVWVDLRFCIETRPKDVACRSTDCFRSIMVSKSQNFREIILAFKLILHDNKCIRRKDSKTPQSELPRGMAMMCWAVAHLEEISQGDAFSDPNAAAASASVCFAKLSALLWEFVDFQWSRFGILVTEAGQCSKVSRLRSSSAPIQVIMEVQIVKFENGKMKYDGNSAYGVEAGTMTKLQKKLRESLEQKNIGTLFQEALENQCLERKLKNVQKYEDGGSQADSAGSLLQDHAAGGEGAETTRRMSQSTSQLPTEISRTVQKARLEEPRLPEAPPPQEGSRRKAGLSAQPSEALPPQEGSRKKARPEAPPPPPWRVAAEEEGGNSTGAQPQSAEFVPPRPKWDSSTVAPESSARPVPQHSAPFLSKRLRLPPPMTAPPLVGPPPRVASLGSAVSAGPQLDRYPSFTTSLQNGKRFASGNYHIEDTMDSAIVEVVVHPLAGGNCRAPIVVLVPGVDGFQETVDTRNSPAACIEIRIHCSGKSRQQAANSSVWKRNPAELVRTTLATVRRWADFSSTAPLHERRHVCVVAFGRGASWMLTLLVTAASLVDFAWILAGQFLGFLYWNSSCFFNQRRLAPPISTVQSRCVRAEVQRF